MDHDGVMSFIGAGKDYVAQAFGPTFQTRSLWMRKYTELKDIIDCFEEFGWEYKGDFGYSPYLQPEYPHHKLKFQKRVGMAPWQYALDGIKIPEDGRILDVGPGNHPWPLANAFLERHSRKNNPAYKDDKLPNNDKIFWGSIETLNKDIPDKYFDFALCSHVFEHLNDPRAAAEELSRIAKKGIVIVPSVYKDALFFWDEQEHIWDCYPGAFQTLNMVYRNSAQVEKVRDKHMQSAMNRLFLGPDVSTSDMRMAKKWFRTHEKDLDVIVEWDGYFEVNIL